MIHTWYKDAKNKKLHYVLNLRYHSNKNIMSSVKFPKNVTFKAISLLSARIHPNNSYNLKTINARNKIVIYALLLPELPTVGQGPIVLRVGADWVVWTFLLSSVLFLLFLPLFGRRPDIDLNTVSKGR